MRYVYEPVVYVPHEDEDDPGGVFEIIDTSLGRNTAIAWTEHRDYAEKIVKALNSVFDGPFALDNIPECVTKEMDQ